MRLQSLQQCTHFFRATWSLNSVSFIPYLWIMTLSGYIMLSFYSICVDTKCEMTSNATLPACHVPFSLSISIYQQTLYRRHKKRLFLTLTVSLISHKEFFDPHFIHRPTELQTCKIKFKEMCFC